MPQITIEIRGLKELQAKLGQFGAQLVKALEGAGQEAGEEVVQTLGVAIYPPETAANQPPPPYYVRGVGTFTGKKYSYTSERYGAKFTVKAQDYLTRIGNTASYGVYVGGAYQPAHMAAKGWRKVYDVAIEKLGKILEIYQGWIDRLIQEVGLE